MAALQLTIGHSSLRGLPVAYCTYARDHTCEPSALRHIPIHDAGYCLPRMNLIVLLVSVIARL
jgi:hypothetical protein